MCKSTTKPFLSPQKRRELLFNCRRGNAESELLLTSFIDELNAKQEIEQFYILLESNDDELLSWLMQPEQSPKQMQKLIQRIRNSYTKQ